MNQLYSDLASRFVCLFVLFCRRRKKINWGK